MGSGSASHWPADTSIPLDPRPIGAVLADWAARTPDHPALVWPAGDALQTLTYQELDDAAGSLAQRLPQPGARVAVVSATSIDWVVLEYASAKAGTTLVPLNPAFTDDEIAHILSMTAPELVLADREFRGTSLLDRMQSLAGDDVVGLADWRSMPARRDALADVDPASAFLVQPTSGTTGRPKGAVLSHRAAYNCAAISAVRLGATADDRWLNPLPMHHVGGSVSVLLSVLSVGATVIIIPTFEPGLVLDLIERARPTIMGAVPTMQLALLDHPRFATTDTSSLRLIQSGGSVVPTSLIRRTEESFGVTLCNAYGQSESPNATMTMPDADDVVKAETIGNPLPQREVAIVDASGEIVPIGEVGELVMRSPLVMDGYLCAETLPPDGWLHTGDLCSMDEHGVLRIRGRLRDVIIRGGENIYPAEVEDIYLRHPAVADVAVIGAPDDHWGEVPVGVYRVAPGASVDDAELEAYGRTRLASFKVPRRWIAVDAFPLTASGKVKKHELRALLTQTSDR